MTLGDQKPSELLRSMMNISSNLPESFVKNLWLQHLPTHVRQILVAQEGDLKKLSVTADTIMTVSSHSNMASMSSEPSTSSQQVQMLEQLTDQVSQVKYLIDTGADVSVIPASFKEKKHLTEVCLFAANGTKIPTYGKRLVSIHISGFQRSFSYPFIIAEVTSPIIGADFLRHYDLLVDLKNYQLIDRSNSRHVNMICGDLDPPGISTICKGNIDPRVTELISQYDITKEQNNVNKIKHNTVHHIVTSGPPVIPRLVACRPTS
ncbi:hypothetical protein WDU94_010886 [Cyamophila willieti]